jgi:hypothetical protein
MIKLITPPAMLVTVALLIIYSVYAFLIGRTEGSLFLTVGAGVSLLAGYGTAMLRPWSRYLVYVLVLGFIGKLGDSVLTAIGAGFFEFQFGSAKEVIWSLTPSLWMTLLSIWCGVAVHRHFARKRPSAGEAVDATNCEQPTGDAQPALSASTHPEKGTTVR